MKAGELNMEIDRKQNPDFLNDYLQYLSVIKGLASRTITEYYMDLRTFLRFIIIQDEDLPSDVDIDEISIKNFDINRLKEIKLDDLYSFLYFTKEERSNDILARLRKITAIRVFFKYLYKQVHLIDENIAEQIEAPKKPKKMPIYMQLDECQRLLEAAAEGKVRDYCIIVLFLNSGMRLSELVGLNVGDVSFEEMRMRVTGKGSKERFVFLNNSCVNALRNYLAVRETNDPKEHALFLSSRGKRISKRRVQQIVEDTIERAGLGGRGLTTHKLRHTAATLMYTYGGADMLALKEILGHESTATTEIYTHISTDSIRSVVDNMPFESMKNNSKEE